MLKDNVNAAMPAVRLTPDIRDASSVRPKQMCDRQPARAITRSPPQNHALTSGHQYRRMLGER